jgi:hypothetical protein
VDAYFKQIPVSMQIDLLAALGLVSYTDALGLIRRWNRQKGIYPRPPYRSITTWSIESCACTAGRAELSSA